MVFVLLKISDEFQKYTHISSDTRSLLECKIQYGDRDSMLIFAKSLLGSSDFHEEMEAVKHLTRAKALGLYEATYLLGECYVAAISVLKDINQANSLFQDVVERARKEEETLNSDFVLGFSSSLNALGKIAFTKNTDFKSCLEYFRESSLLGNCDAMYNLGILFLKQDQLRLAFQWIESSALLGCSAAMKELSQFYSVGLFKPKQKMLSQFWKKMSKGETANCSFLLEETEIINPLSTSAFLEGPSLDAASCYELACYYHQTKKEEEEMHYLFKGIALDFWMTKRFRDLQETAESVFKRTKSQTSKLCLLAFYCFSSELRGMIYSESPSERYQAIFYSIRGIQGFDNQIVFNNVFTKQDNLIIWMDAIKLV